MPALRTVRSALETAMPELSFQSSEVIGPQVSGELKRDGIIAVSVRCIHGAYLYLVPV